jgi:hypothetical protein
MYVSGSGYQWLTELIKNAFTSVNQVLGTSGSQL